MNLAQWADHLARRVVVPHCNAWYVADTEYRQEKVIADCAAQVLIELEAVLAEHFIRLE